jgi:hypothetical protein
MDSPPTCISACEAALFTAGVVSLAVISRARYGALAE